MRRRTTVLIVVAVFVAVLVIGAAGVFLASRDGGDPAMRHRTERGTEKSTIRAATLDRIEAQFDEHLAACTEPGTDAPPSCGIAVPWAADFAALDSIRYRIERSPALTFTPPTFRAEDGILIATVTGPGFDGATKTLTYRTENWMLRGTVSVKRGGVVLSVW